MKENLIKYIKELIIEHEESGFCTNYDWAMNELGKDIQNAFDYAYDCGRYDTLKETLYFIENL